MPITSFIFSMSSIVSGTSAFIVSGRKKYGIAASTVKRPIATLGKTLSISDNKSTIKGAKAAPILELASRKQNAAFLVEVGKSSGEWRPQPNQNIAEMALPETTKIGTSQLLSDWMKTIVIPKTPHVMNAKISLQ